MRLRLTELLYNLHTAPTRALSGDHGWDHDLRAARALGLIAIDAPKITDKGMRLLTRHIAGPEICDFDARYSFAMNIPLSSEPIFRYDGPSSGNAFARYPIPELDLTVRFFKTEIDLREFIHVVDAYCTEPA